MRRNLLSFSNIVELRTHLCLLKQLGEMDKEDARRRMENRNKLWGK